MGVGLGHQAEGGGLPGMNPLAAPHFHSIVPFIVPIGQDVVEPHMLFLVSQQEDL